MLENPSYRVLHITTTFQFDLDTFTSIMKGNEQLSQGFEDQSRLSNIQYARFFNVSEVIAQIDTILKSPDYQPNMIVIEDLCDLFNTDHFKNSAQGK